MEGIFLGFKKLNLPPNLNVVSVAKQSTGLVNQKFFDWQNALENELKTLKGDVLVVVHFGPNDMLNAKINGQSVAFGDRKWREFYATQVQNIYKIVHKHKHEIAWLQTPCMKRDDLRKGMPILNEIYALAAKKNGANFIDTNRFFCKNGDIILEKNIDKKAACIFFLPGLSADHRLFCFQIPYFTSKYTVLTWDAPAHGKSRPYKDFSYSNSADELKKILNNMTTKTTLKKKC